MEGRQGATVDATKIEDLLTKVSGLRASSFEHGPGRAEDAGADGQGEVRQEEGNRDARPRRRRRLRRRPDEPGTAKLDAAASTKLSRRSTR